MEVVHQVEMVAHQEEACPEEVHLGMEGVENLEVAWQEVIAQQYILQDSHSSTYIGGMPGIPGRGNG